MRLAIVDDSNNIISLLPVETFKPGIGRMGELIVHQKLMDIGIFNTVMPSDSPFDIFTDSGLLIEVKAAHKSMNNARECYAFAVKDSWQFHFIVVWAVDDDDFYIMGASDLAVTGVLRIYPSASRWKKHKNDWGAIKEYVEWYEKYKKRT